MARAMFEYTKTVLEKVSFNTELFKLELEKAVNRLLPFELKELALWLKSFTINKPQLSPYIALIETK